MLASDDKSLGILWSPATEVATILRMGGKKVMRLGMVDMMQALMEPSGRRVMRHGTLDTLLSRKALDTMLSLKARRIRPRILRMGGKKVGNSQMTIKHEGFVSIPQGRSGENCNGGRAPDIKEEPIC